jgi:glycosyltransferase involved in cell wall biosynthesis
MRVLYISPTYFSDRSFIGGGERYAYELAKAMARKEEVAFLTFGDEMSSHRDGTLMVQNLRRATFLKRCFKNPLSPLFVKWVYWADVIHCHQVHTISTDLAVILGKLFRKRVFVTDLGGGDKYALSYHLPILKWVDAFLLISEYSGRLWERASLNSRPDSLHVINGGVDTEKYSPANGKRSKAVLFVGRLLPHKGIDYLIDAINGKLSLDVVGRIYHEGYFDLLKAKSRGKAVTFHATVDDEELVERYRHSSVTVLPSVYETCYGDRTVVPELLGLAALESMACGTPVIVTEVASLPEIVEHGVTGFLVPPNNPTAIREKIEYLHANLDVAEEMGKRGRETVLKRFTWDAAARRCLDIYRDDKRHNDR